MERIRQLLQTSRPIKWLFYGDSITHGSFHTFGWRDYTQLFAERVRSELGRSQDTVLNTAVSGDTVNDLLAGFDRRVAPFQPDVVFVMIGMNDCSAESGIGREVFARQLGSLADRLVEERARPVLQTTCPVLAGDAPERAPHFADFMDAIRTVAADRALPLIDHERVWRRQPERHVLWMSDAFHPNHYGHRAFAALIFRELGIQDGYAPSCSFFVP